MTAPDSSKEQTSASGIEGKDTVPLSLLDRERELARKSVIDVIGEENLKMFLEQIDSKLKTIEHPNRLDVGRAISTSLGMFESRKISTLIPEFYVVALNSDQKPVVPHSTVVVSSQPQSSTSKV